MHYSFISWVYSAAERVNVIICCCFFIAIAIENYIYL